MLLHPSDFRAGSEVALAHAVKLALVTPHDLTLLHVVSKVEEPHRTEFSAVSSMLERWGLLPKGSSEADVPEAGIRVERVTQFFEEPSASILHYLKEYTAELVVLSTDQRAGVVRWLQESVAEPVARHARAATLFVPSDVSGFVSVDDGSSSLKNILVPVDAVPAPQPAVDAASNMARLLGNSGVSLRAIHIGNGSDLPSLSESGSALKPEALALTGGVVEQIVEKARDWPADLIVMGTAGHHGFLDALRGSTTERVLRRAPCPLLAVPPTASTG